MRGRAFCAGKVDTLAKKEEAGLEPFPQSRVLWERRVGLGGLEVGPQHPRV